MNLPFDRSHIIGNDTRISWIPIYYFRFEKLSLQRARRVHSLFISLARGIHIAWTTGPRFAARRHVNIRSMLINDRTWPVGLSCLNRVRLHAKSGISTLIPTAALIYYYSPVILVEEEEERKTRRIPQIPIFRDIDFLLVYVTMYQPVRELVSLHFSSKLK